jgi:hypothetical protein
MGAGREVIDVISVIVETRAAQMADAGAAGEQEPEMPGADEVSDEDIVAVLDQMVQSGELTPDIAAQIMQALQGGGEAGGAGGEMPPGAGGEMPPGAGGEMPPGAEGGMPPGAEAMMAQGGEGEQQEPDGDEEEKGARTLLKSAAATALKVLAEIKK